MKFTTKLSQLTDVDIYPYSPTHEFECISCLIEWEVAFEVREYGIKDIQVIVYKAEFEILKTNEETGSEEVINVSKGDFEYSIEKGNEIDGIWLDYITIDLEEKTIIINR